MPKQELPPDQEDETKFERKRLKSKSEVKRESNSKYTMSI
jgi:hypothetical protein